jgi:hypothetical protein
MVDDDDDNNNDSKMCFQTTFTLISRFSKKAGLIQSLIFYQNKQNFLKNLEVKVINLSI